ncbi:MAG: RNase adapter RapZ [Pseudomonadales bacterium]|jgi:UPF0042 nucleotide-binding protein|nr:RNase adapter RapZ [Pseudomonadales bacterium]
MKLVVISGRSGSGKSTALHALEDQGHHCIDNLPVGLLPSLMASASERAQTMPLAVSIDARNLPEDLERFPEILETLQRSQPELSVDVVYMDAEITTLVRRFSETRRRHPLTDDATHLREALEAESELLQGIANLADLTLDTTSMTLHVLRSEIRARVAERGARGASVMVRSFGFRGGVPLDADMVFDVRCLPNPHWHPDLRDLTGRDAPVIEWLEQQDEVQRMYEDIHAFLTRWLPSFERNNRSYLTIAIGCTGGQHRSVYLADRLGRALGGSAGNALVRHRELGTPVEDAVADGNR